MRESGGTLGVLAGVCLCTLAAKLQSHPGVGFGSGTGLRAALLRPMLSLKPPRISNGSRSWQHRLQKVLSKLGHPF